MSSIAQSGLSANLVGALLLAALPVLRDLGLPHPTAKAVLSATQAKKTPAYTLAKALVTSLPTLERPVGRPAKREAMPGADESARLAALTKDVLSYLYRHPGAVGRSGHRSKMSGDFKQHVVALCAKNRDLDIERIAGALSLPASTLREWVRTVDKQVEASDTSSSPPAPTAAQQAIKASTDLAIQTVLDQHRTWEGTFTEFCQHLAQHHQLRLGRTAIASLLQQAGVRLPTKRPGRSPDDKAMRATFCTFFPGAQWTADGTEISIALGGHVFVFNLELAVDTCSGAFVGLDIRDHEDANAVIASFEDGVSATGSPPLALLLDNKACNLCPEVDEATGETLCISATPARPQNKGHVEGAFGLFAQHAPPLVVDASSPKTIAQSIVELVTRTFFGALNMRPRKTRGGQSRIDIYTSSAPTPEQVRQATVALQARQNQQRDARQTLRARQCPHKRTALSLAFARLELEDPTGNILDACARYPLDDILDGIAIFTAKRHSASLPDDLEHPARYLLGIIKNVARQGEGMAIAHALWDERLRARERIFDPLFDQRKRILHDTDDTSTILNRFVDCALETDRAIEEHFWLTSIAEHILREPERDRHGLFIGVARAIHTTYAAAYARRLAAVQLVAAAVLPVA